MQKNRWKKQDINVFEQMLICLLLMMCILLFRGTGICSNGMGGMNNNCVNNFECSHRDFCEKDIGQCTGQGECTDKPRSCTQDWDPVCGCDGNTYPNKCEADRRGISVDYLGQCSPGVTPCNDNSICSPDSYCQKTSGACTAQGSCAPRPAFCSQVWDPVCGCDGTTYPNECEATVSGVNVAYEDECSPGVTPCNDNSICSPDSYCKKTSGACTAQGSCAPRPAFCAQVWDPLCGCNGITYPNECEAAAQGVNVNHNGECQPGAVTCTSNSGCSPDSYCQKATGNCTAQGICTRRTHMCPQIWDPVCGCNGITYPNECEAAAQGVNVNHNGECQPGAVTCTKNNACPTGSYCQRTLGNCTGQGECVPAPQQCPEIWSPVCGCDGDTYPNECFAAASGINVDYAGECSPVTVSCADSSTCPTGSYCQKTPGNCNTGEGRCATKPDVCAQTWTPVCGCDGKTYPNECEASVKGINVNYAGECAGTGPGCINNSNCQATAPGTVCQKRPGNCNGQGICSPPPNSCPEIWSPICGCDGKTYPNGCTATSIGVNIDYTGQCSGSGVSCSDNNTCTVGFYCKKAPGDCAGDGECVPVPEACAQIWDPVCGCDNLTYPNECEAAKLRVTVNYPGECSAAGMLCQNNNGCPSFAYCQKSPGQCTGGFGECKFRPEFCIQVNSPVCGCDGKTYSNGCMAAANGVNVKKTGECPTYKPPPGYPYGGLLGGLLFGGFPFGGFPFGGFPYGGYFGGGFPYGGYFGGGFPYGGFQGGGFPYGGYFGGTTYPGFTGGTTYPGYFGGTTYPGYFGGTTFPGFTGGTTYPGYFGGTTYPGFTGGTTYPGYFGGTTYPGYFGTNPYSRFIGSTYP